MDNKPLILLGVTSALSVRFFNGQVSSLRQAGFEVRIVSSPGKELDAVSVQDSIRVAGISMNREISPLADCVSIVRLVSLLRRWRPTITDFGTPKAGLLGGVAALLTRVPIRGYKIRGLRLETAQGWKRRLLTSAERLACKCAHRINCVSPSLRDRVIELGLAPAHKVSVLAHGTSNGVAVSRFAPTESNLARADATRLELAIPRDAPVIGFVGRFTRDKGIRELMEAYAELRLNIPDLRLLLVGCFEDGDPVSRDVRDQIENDPHIIRPGFVSDTSPYYHLMDLLVLPTYREGFPGVPLEAQAAGKPVVTTNATGAIDSVQDGVTGLIVPVGDSKALAGAIRRLLQDQPLREAMGRAGQEWVAREFNGDRVRAALVEEYQKLIAAHINRKATFHQSRWKMWGKRKFDVMASVLGLLILSPLMAITALMIRVSMGWPVLFWQLRPGKGTRPFTLFKFRTMNDKRDDEGRLLPDGERLTRVGRFLRATSLDELPQLWNVLRGDMSLVGPRPLLMEYLSRYTPEQARRHDVRPGITGWAQANGRNALSWEDKFVLDLWYVDHGGLLLDLKILAITVWHVVKRNGIANGHHATMPKFAGSGQERLEQG